MTYLIDTYAPGHPIYPKEPAVRAHIDRLLFRDISFVAQNVNAFLVRWTYMVETLIDASYTDIRLNFSLVFENAVTAKRLQRLSCHVSFNL